MFLPGKGICLAYIRAVICCLEDGSLTLGLLCPDIISFQNLQQLSLFNTSFCAHTGSFCQYTLLLRHYTKKPTIQKNIYVCFRITKTYKFFWKWVRTHYSRVQKIVTLLPFIGFLWLPVDNLGIESTASICSKDGTGKPICRSALSQKYFLFLVYCLRFDDKTTRVLRRADD